MPAADAAQARERMRRIRAKAGGSSAADRARNRAIRELIERHRVEFAGLLHGFSELERERDRPGR
jgi:hypothetical protein